MPPPGLIIVKIQSNCLAFFTCGLREHYIMCIFTSPKKSTISPLNPPKKKEEKRFCIPSTIKQEDLFLQYSINMNIPYIWLNNVILTIVGP